MGLGLLLLSPLKFIMPRLTTLCFEPPDELPPNPRTAPKEPEITVVVVMGLFILGTWVVVVVPELSSLLLVEVPPITPTLPPLFDELSLFVEEPSLFDEVSPEFVVLEASVLELLSFVFVLLVSVVEPVPVLVAAKSLLIKPDGDAGTPRSFSISCSVLNG